MNEFEKYISEDDYNRNYCTVIAETEDGDEHVDFNKYEFLESIKYNPEFNSVEEYLIDYLNHNKPFYNIDEYEYFCCLVEPMPEELRSAAELRIESSKFNL